MLLYKYIILTCKYMSDVSQIKVTVPKRMREFLDTKASNLGLATSVYIKHLIIKDIEDLDFPEYQASDITEQSIEEAIKEYKDGKTKKFSNPKDLIQSLQ